MSTTPDSLPRPAFPPAILPAPSDLDHLERAVAEAVKGMSVTAEKLAIVGAFLGFSVDAPKPVIVERLQEIRRQLRAATADKARLDWLDRNAIIRDRTLAVMERDGDTLRWADIEWNGRDPICRAAIDEAMKP